MIGEIDSLSRIWEAPEPPRLHTAENADADGEDFRDQEVAEVGRRARRNWIYHKDTEDTEIRFKNGIFRFAAISAGAANLIFSSETSCPLCLCGKSDSLLAPLTSATSLESELPFVSPEQTAKNLHDKLVIRTLR
jgi:hypothetical protein